MQNVGGARNWAYQSTLYATQGKESKGSLMREIAEKETAEHILCECLVLEKIRMQTLGFARMYLDQIKGETEQYCGLR